MRKLPLIVTFSQPGPVVCRIACRLTLATVLLAFSAVWPDSLAAQEGPETDQPVYPKAVATAGDKLFVLDLDLPGIWEIGESRTLFVKGSPLLRKALNRPHCVTLIRQAACWSATRRRAKCTGSIPLGPSRNR